MALDIGALYGTIDIKDAPFQAGLDRAFDALGAFGTDGAKKAALIGAAIASALAVSLVQNIGMDAANDKLAAQLALTEDEAERAGANAGALYADAYGESMDQVNEAIGSVITNIQGMRGATDDQLQGVTATVLDLAKAFDQDLGGITRAVGDLMRNGLAPDATAALDLIAAGFTSGLDRGEDFLDTINEYAPDFRELGLSGEEAFALIAQGLDAGARNADLVADAMREFGDVVKDDAVGAGKAIEQLGLDAGSLLPALAAGGPAAKDAFGQVIAAVNSMTDPIARQEAGVALFGTKFLDLGPQVFAALSPVTASLGDVAGAGDDLGERLNTNASASLESLRRQAELAFAGLMSWAVPGFAAVAAAASDSFGPAVIAAGDALAWVTDKLDQILGPLGGAGEVGTWAGVALLTILVPALIVWGIQSTIAGAKAAAAWLLAQGAAVRSVAVQTAAGIRAALAWTIQQGPMLATAGMALLNFGLIAAGWVMAGISAMAGAVAMAAAWLVAIWPIALVVAAIAGVVALVVIYWDEIKAFTAAAWDWVVGLVRGAIDWIVDIFMNFTGPGLIIKHWETIKSTVSAGVGAVVGFVTELPGKIMGALTGAKDWLVGVGEDVMNGLKAGIENGFQWIEDKLGGLGKLIPGWLKDVLGISSPSKVMRDQVGVWIPAGIADGITAGSPAVQAAMDDLMTIPDVGMPLPRNIGRAQVRGSDGAALGQQPTVHVDVHPSEGMDEERLGRVAGRETGWRLHGTGGLGA